MKWSIRLATACILVLGLSGLGVVSGAIPLSDAYAANCLAGFYDNGSGCMPAPPGSYVPTAGATAPTPCPLGTYQPNSGQTSCLSTPAGSYDGKLGSVFPTPCAAGSYSPAAGAAACTLADPGFFVPLPGSSVETPCPAGTTSLSPGATVCTSAVPTTKDQCKEGSWETFAQFKNQGDCVSFVNQENKVS